MFFTSPTEMRQTQNRVRLLDLYGILTKLGESECLAEWNQQIKKYSKRYLLLTVSDPITLCNTCRHAGAQLLKGLASELGKVHNTGKRFYEEFW